MTRLSVERLFSGPPLTGRLPTEPKLTRDGRYATYLRKAPDDHERLDLWCCDLTDGSEKCLIDSSALLRDGTSSSALSAAEKAARERRRQFHRGVTNYEFSADGAYVLIPMDGAGILFHVASAQMQRFTPAGSRQTDLHFSPRGSFVSFVRDGNLYLYDVAAGTERALTHENNEWISNGLADFIAQEEMHRYRGYWWSEDETQIAFTRVDESPIRVSQRFEIDADDVRVVAQRYPYAGETNATVTLCVLDLASEKPRWLPWQTHADDYLARVDWAGDALLVQAQSRDQQSLQLKSFDPATGDSRIVLTERSKTWLNLHDNVRHLGAGRMLWTSERDGFSHLYLYDLNDGAEATQLTQGRGMVNEVLHADEHRAIVNGWFDTPTEQHVYRVDYASRRLERLTTRSAWNEGTVDATGRWLLMRWTSLNHPGELELHDLTGAARNRTIAHDRLNAQHPYHPFLDDHITPELGTLPAADGQTLHYRLTRPAVTPVPGPAIVFVYGGPGVQRVKQEWAPLSLQLLAQRGFTILELDNRGSSNRGRDFEAPIYRRLGKIEIQDQLAGAEFLRSLDGIDGDRIGVFGHSYGGYMTLMCLAQAPEVFKAGVAVAPVTDWRLYDTHYTERYLTTPDGNATGYHESSVFPYLERLKDLRGGLLLMHGMADDNVLFTNSTRLMKSLQDLNIAFELMTYPGSKHSLQERAVSIHRFNLIIDFFQRKLAAA